jgi:rhodanese-related sulfurtransferase
MNVDFLKFVEDNILLVGIALLSGGMLLWPLMRRGTSGPSVNTLEATQMINQRDGLVLDVREQSEYSRGRVLNARHIPLAQIEARLRDLEKHKRKPVIVCCETGNRSRSAVTLLRKHGFEHAFSLSGGLAAWRQAGLPLEKD